MASNNPQDCKLCLCSLNESSTIILINSNVSNPSELTVQDKICIYLFDLDSSSMPEEALCTDCYIGLEITHQFTIRAYETQKLVVNVNNVQFFTEQHEAFEEKEDKCFKMCFLCSSTARVLLKCYEIENKLAKCFPYSDFTIIQNPLLCIMCFKLLNAVYLFKEQRIERNAHIREKFNSIDWLIAGLDLEPAPYKPSNVEAYRKTLLDDVNDAKRCRICLITIDKQLLRFALDSVTDLKVQHSVQEKIIYCLPGLDLKIAPNAMLCTYCCTFVDQMYINKIQNMMNIWNIEQYIENILHLWDNTYDTVAATFSKFCGTCLRNTKIFKAKKLNCYSVYNKMILFFPETDFRVISNLNICVCCQIELDRMYSFMQQCYETEEILSEYLESNHSTTDSSDLVTSFQNKFSIEDKSEPEIEKTD